MKKTIFLLFIIAIAIINFCGCKPQTPPPLVSEALSLDTCVIESKLPELRTSIPFGNFEARGMLCGDEITDYFGKNQTVLTNIRQRCLTLMTIEIIRTEYFAIDISPADKILYIWYQAEKSAPIYCSVANYGLHKITTPLRQKFGNHLCIIENDFLIICDKDKKLTKIKL